MLLWFVDVGVPAAVSNKHRPAKDQEERTQAPSSTVPQASPQQTLAPDAPVAVEPAIGNSQAAPRRLSISQAGRTLPAIQAPPTPESSSQYSSSHYPPSSKSSGVRTGRAKSLSLSAAGSTLSAFLARCRSRCKQDRRASDSLECKDVMMDGTEKSLAAAHEPINTEKCCKVVVKATAFERGRGE